MTGASPVVARVGLAGTSTSAAAANAGAPSGPSLRSVLAALRLGGCTPANAPASTASTAASDGAAAASVAAAASGTGVWQLSAGWSGRAVAAELDGAGGNRSARLSRLQLSAAGVVPASLAATGSEAAAAAALELSCTGLPPGDAGGLLPPKNDLQAVKAHNSRAAYATGMWHCTQVSNGIYSCTPSPQPMPQPGHGLT